MWLWMRPMLPTDKNSPYSPWVSLVTKQSRIRGNWNLQIRSLCSHPNFCLLSQARAFFQALWIGASSKNKTEPLKFQCPKDPIKFLVIYLSLDAVANNNNFYTFIKVRKMGQRFIYGGCGTCRVFKSTCSRRPTQVTGYFDCLCRVLLVFHSSSWCWGSRTQNSARIKWQFLLGKVKDKIFGFWPLTTLQHNNCNLLTQWPFNSIQWRGKTICVFPR